MKILLKEDVDNLGFAGDEKTVANGFARNYLIPNGFAVKATPNVLKSAEKWRVKAAARREQLLAEYAELAGRIADTTVEFTRLAGENGRLFGSVTTNDVADALNEALGTDIDRRKVIGESIRDLGAHYITVRLSGGHQPQVTVNVLQEKDAESAAVFTDAEAETQAIIDASIPVAAPPSAEPESIVDFINEVTEAAAGTDAE